MDFYKGIVVAVLAVVVAIWTQRESELDFVPQTTLTVPACPAGASEVHLLFGGTSVLGGYIVDSWKREFPEVCLVNYNRKTCEKCDVSINGDIRDTKFVEKVFEHFNGKDNKLRISTVILSVKPALIMTSWKTFAGVNYQSLIEITNLAKKYGVSQLLYTSSIASSSHFIEHKMATEADPQPLMTDYRVPYDLTKRLAEDYILGSHSDDFKTVALRVSGIIGGSGDPFFHHRVFPFLITFNSPIVIDYGFAGNIADAWTEVYKVLSQDSKVGGQFYYFTGEHIHENVTGQVLSDVTGKILIPIPHSWLGPFLEFWQWIRPDHLFYTYVDLVRLADIEQTFDQSKFHGTFPNFKPKWTIVEALKYLYSE